MSLLWRTAAWWNTEPDDVHEYEAGLRDSDEDPKARGQRYVSQVVDRHNVNRGAAEKAIKHVIGHHDDDSIFTSPEDYGFASSGNQMSHYSNEMSAKLMNPATWRGRKVEQVSLKQPIHATQNFLRPQSIAHNLFHPGKHESEHDDSIGDPDYNPDWDADSRAESDEMRDAEGSTPEERELHKNVYFMRRNNGRLEVVDGHHRVATDMLLGKSHTPGIVLHERELEHGNEPVKVHDIQEHLEKDHRQNYLDPSWDPHEFHDELHVDPDLEEEDHIPHRHPGQAV